MVLRSIATAAALLAASAAQSGDCGGEAEPCAVASGAYHMVLPDGWQGGPAVMHLHGYGGSGAKVIRNTGFVNGFLARGYAVIAPSAVPWRDGEPSDWAVRDGWNTYPRNDIAFLREILADAADRAKVDPGRLLLSGFSRGGSMVWEVACLAPGFARAYAPASGGFWLPLTEDCTGPVDMLHAHGFADKVVPLEGRQWPNAELKVTFRQADIWQGLQLWRRENGCPENAAGHEVAGELWRKRWHCDEGSLELILHGGGHTLPKGWTALALDWFESLNP